MKTTINRWLPKAFQLIPKGVKQANRKRHACCGNKCFQMENLEARICFSNATLDLAAHISEPETLIITGDDWRNHEAVSGDGYDGVVWIGSTPFGQSTKGNGCSGSLLESGKHILTAAHCVTDELGRFRFASSVVGFDLPSLQDRQAASAYYIHPDWNGQAAHGNDLAIMELANEAPALADRYPIWRQVGTDVGHEFVKVGYGLVGHGNSGSEEGTEGTRHFGENRYDVSGDASKIKFVNGEKQLVYDFDNGKPENDALGHYGIVRDTGLGSSREANAARGDSGGPSFLDGHIAGVTSWSVGFIGLPDVSPGTNGSFGEISVDTRVAAFADWIDAVIETPKMLVNGVHGRPAVTNEPNVTVAFTNLDDSAIGVRFAVNNFNYPAEWETIVENISIPIPTYRGVNYVNAEVKFQDGSTKHFYQRIVYATPNMKINGGNATTNSQEVILTFPNVSSAAEQVQIVVNGRVYSDWQTLESEHHVRLNFKGTNYLKAHLRYDDGTQRTVYEKIKLSDAVLTINDGTVLTNTGSLQIAIGNLAEDAREVQFRINGRSHEQPFDLVGVDGNAVFELPKLTYKGPNYIEADILYDNGRIRTLYGSIEYANPKLVLNDGAISTTSRTITATLQNVASNVTEMRVGFNGSEPVLIGSFQPTFELLLPNWHGTNYVMIELDYGDGLSRTLYAQIIFEDSEESFAIEDPLP